MLEIGSIIDGKYKILNKIGQGGMSVVYLAMNEKANKQWAIKEVRKDGVKDFEVVKQGLMGEIEMLKRLNHPNLPSIIDVIETDGTFLIVMDYIQGNPLSDAINEYGAQPQENIIAWAKQLCDVLGYLHSRNPAIIYRDMKPANVMLKPEGNITLIDFGTAREYKEQNFADTTCLGTQGYAAPEQFGGQGQTDARTDIYTLGATLYHLVTGHNPCEPPYEMYPIRQWNPSLSSGLERIITKCTQRNPADRYQNCSELMYALEHYEEIDDIYKKKQKKQLVTFISTTVSTVVFGITALTGTIMADKTRLANYNNIIEIAAKGSNTEKQSEYLKAIEIDPSRKEAYLELVNYFTGPDDYKLTTTESSVITKLEKEKINNSNSSRMDYLKSTMLAYLEFAYETGMAYWYYSDEDRSLHSQATYWLSIVAGEETDIRMKNRAKTFVAIGEFHGNIRRLQDVGEDGGQYKKYWENLKNLKKANDGNPDTDVITIRLYSEVINQIFIYAKDFKDDGITKQDITAVANDIYSAVEKMDSNKVENEVNALITMKQDTTNMIKSAYCE